MKKISKVLLISLAFMALFFGAHLALATTTLDVGVDQVSSTIKLSDANPLDVVSRIVNIGLSFLGFIAVCIILWGGFTWMKSGGSEEQITKAKNILKAGVIGLLIIVTAWGITTFVISKMIGGSVGSDPDITDPSLCSNGLSCLCGGHVVCTGNVGSCVGSISPCTNPQTSCSSAADSCVPADGLCGANQVCNNSCFCESKTQDGDSCGLKADGTCDLSGDNCEDGLTCNANSCTCEGPTTIMGVSPLGGFCKTSINTACNKDSDCPSSTCDTETPNGKAGNFLTILVSNLFKASNSAPVSLENFESYPVDQTPSSTVFIGLQKGAAANILIKNNPYNNSKSLFLHQDAGNVTGTGANAEIAYNFSGVNFIAGHVYQASFQFQGFVANRMEVYFGDQHIYDLAPGQYTYQRNITFGADISVAKKMRIFLVAGPTGNGTDLYIDNLKIHDLTAKTSVNIGGVFASSTSQVYQGCLSSNNQLIVVVPPGVQNGEIKIIRDQEVESTNDDNGPKINNFLVNNIDRPGICGLNPTVAKTDDSISIYGVKMAGGKSFFGNYEEKLVGGTIAADSVGSVKVPMLEEGKNGLFVEKGLQKSNFLFFTKTADLPPAPTITGISPDSGPIDQYVTIIGHNFGENRGNGKVFFGDKEANYNFPDECKIGTWSDTQILVKVPAGINPATSNIKVQTDNWTAYSASSNIYFNYLPSAQLLPGICRIDPDRGPANSETKIFGENFGNSASEVYFNALLASSTITLGTKVHEAKTIVPVDAVSGPVTIKNKSGLVSNPVNFQVGSCSASSDCPSDRVCCSEATIKKGQCVPSADDCVLDVKSSVFEWNFSTAITGTTTSVTGSCLGASKTLGACSTGSTCPNVPGKCSSGSEVIQVEKGACCPAGYAFKEVVSTDIAHGYTEGRYCRRIISPSVCEDVGVAGSFCKNLPDYAGKNRLVYPSNTTCKQGWIKIAGNLCAKGATAAGLKITNNCSLCTTGENCIWGSCISNTKCNGAEQCNASGTCIIEEAPTCDCCCDKNNGAADCCAPLTCEGKCGSDKDSSSTSNTFGKCSGCAISPTDIALNDAACNCSGHNGQYCAVSEAFKAGACVDCSGLDEKGCLDHASACCLDSKNLDGNGKPVCRGGSGKLISSNPLDTGKFGFCASFKCSGGATNKCASSTPVVNGDFSSVEDCEKNCQPTTPNTGLGLNCGGGASTATPDKCNPSVCSGAFGATPFTCLATNGTSITSGTPSAGGECGVCCCSPGSNDSCKAVNSKLYCQADRGSCSGGSRGLCCGCSSDTDCGIGDTGCGTDSCCYQKPKVLLDSVLPKADAIDVCRNTSIRVAFDHVMDGETINTNNIKLLEEFPGGTTCPVGTSLAVESLKDNFLAKVYHRVELVVASIFKVFDKSLAIADSTSNYTYCQVPISVEAIDASTGFATGTWAIIKPKVVLAKSKNYVIFVKGNNKDVAPADGVLSLDGVGMAASVGIGYDDASLQAMIIESKSFETQITDTQSKIEQTIRDASEALRLVEKITEYEAQRNKNGFAIVNSVEMQKEELINLEENVQKINEIEKTDINLQFEIFKAKAIGATDTIDKNQKLLSDDIALIKDINNDLSKKFEDYSQRKVVTGDEKTFEAMRKNLYNLNQDLQKMVDEIEYARKVEADNNYKYEQASDVSQMIDDITKFGELKSELDQKIASYTDQSQGGTFYQGAVNAKINSNTYKAFISRFKTKADICEINYTKLSPSQYLFSTVTNEPDDSLASTTSFDKKEDRDKIFNAQAYSVDGQELLPVTGYSWTWDYKLEDPSIITLATSTPMAQALPSGKVLATALSTTNDGKSLLYATVKMPTSNQYKGGDGKKTSSELYVFICANPWPTVKNGTWAPWTDASVSGQPGSNYNYGFHYCRDAGEPGTADDLPALEESGVTNIPKKVCSNNLSKTCSDTTPCTGSDGTCIWDVFKESYFFQKN
ncbi:MAG: IPT/TIG domain-containing protein [Patescibacteria group bacterium]